MPEVTFDDLIPKRPPAPPRPMSRTSAAAQAMAGPAAAPPPPPDQQAPQAAAQTAAGLGLASAAANAPAAPQDAGPKAVTFDDLIPAARPQDTPQGETAIPVDPNMPQGPAAVAAPRVQKSATSLFDDLVGAVETVATVASSSVAAPAGQVAGVLSSMFGGNYGTQAGVTQGAQTAERVQDSLTYAPRTAAGQQQTQALGDALGPIGEALPMMPATGELAMLPSRLGAAATQARATGAGQAAEGAARTAGRAVAAPVKAAGGMALDVGARVGGKVAEVLAPADPEAPRLVDRARAARAGRAAPSEATPGTMASGGSAGTDLATQRRERAAELGINLTEGQATRNADQLQFERETAKLPEGEALRANYDEQNVRATRALGDMADRAGGNVTDRAQVGEKVVDALTNRQKAEKQRIRALYDEAKAAGETEAPVSTEGLATYLNENRAAADTGLAKVLNYAKSSLEKLKAVESTDGGDLIGTTAKLDDLEGLRVKLGEIARDNAGTSEATHAIKLRNLIDATTAGAGGDKYRAARAAYAAYAGEFKGQRVVRDLLATVKGTSDRQVAFDNVFRRISASSDPRDVEKLRRTLMQAGPEGVQAVRELEGQTYRHVLEQATSNTSRDQMGNAILSADKFGKAVAALDRDGRLDALVGKKGAERLRDMRELIGDIYTVPPGVLNHSNTAASLKRWIVDAGVSGATTGLPVPLMHAAKAARDWHKGRQLRRQIAQALNGGQGPATRMDMTPRALDPVDVHTLQPLKSVKAPETDPRLVEIDRMRQDADPATLRILDKRVEAIMRDNEATARAVQADAESKALEASAGKTSDPALRQALLDEAERKRMEPLPTGEAREVPVERFTDGTPDGGGDGGDVPPDGPPPGPRGTPGRGGAAAEPAQAAATASATTAPRVAARAAQSKPAERVPEPVAVEIDMRAWRRAHQLGTLEARRAENVARADQIDPAAVERAAREHRNRPADFDRAIAAINERGRHESDTRAAAEGGARPEPPAPGSGRTASRSGDATGDRQGEGPAPETPAQRSLTKAVEAFDRDTAPSGDPITDGLAAKVRDFDRASQEYAQLDGAEGGRVLDTDLARELSPEYRADRSVSAKVQKPAGAFIRRAYAEKLAQDTPDGLDRVVAFTGGGTGAGKTVGRAAMADSLSEPEIFYDTNLDQLSSSVQKIRQALDAGRDVTIAYVHAPPEVALRRAMDRAQGVAVSEGGGRTVPLDVFVRTHVGARKALDGIARRFAGNDRVRVDIVDNSRDVPTIEPYAAGRLPEIDENGLYEQLRSTVEQARAAGRIDDRIARGFLGQQTEVRDTGRSGSVRAPVRREDQGTARAGLGADALIGPAGSTAEVTVRGRRTPVRYRLIEADTLRAGGDADETRVNRVRSGLLPGMLGAADDADSGAPVMGDAGTVEAGNVRAVALRRAYRSGAADEYRSWLFDHANDFGLEADDVERMRQPVLVRARVKSE